MNVGRRPFLLHNVTQLHRTTSHRLHRESCLQVRSCRCPSKPSAASKIKSVAVCQQKTQLWMRPHRQLHQKFCPVAEEEIPTAGKHLKSPEFKACHSLHFCVVTKPRDDSLGLTVTQAREGESERSKEGTLLTKSRLKAALFGLNI